MPNTSPNFNSFLNSSQFNSNIPSGNPIIAGIVAGSTYVVPVFGNAGACASTTNPGGLFGWLIYARTAKSTPAIGTTAAPYIVYNNVSDFVGDLNKLSGATGAVLLPTGSGGTYSFFEEITSTKINCVVPQGNDFLHCLHYLAYGARLIIAGTTTGLNLYESETGNSIEIFLGNTFGSSSGAWFREKPYLIGIFPSGSSGDGKGFTAQNFDTYLGGAQYVAGTTIPSRIFNVFGVNGGTYSTTSMQSSSELEYEIPAISDVGGAFNTSKNLNQLFLTIGGLDRSRVLNKKINNPIAWESSDRTILRTNRVNFYVDNSPTFLGGDLVGATMGSSTINISERIGPAFLKKVLTREITEIGTKYLFELNDATTRSSVTTEIEALLDSYSYAIVRSEAQVVCNSTNNSPDYTQTLNISVTIRPILGIDSFIIDISLTA